MVLKLFVPEIDTDAENAKLADCLTHQLYLVDQVPIGGIGIDLSIQLSIP